MRRACSFNCISCRFNRQSRRRSLLCGWLCHCCCLRCRLFFVNFCLILLLLLGLFNNRFFSSSFTTDSLSSVFCSCWDVVCRRWAWLSSCVFCGRSCTSSISTCILCLLLLLCNFFLARLFVGRNSSINSRDSFTFNHGRWRFRRWFLRGLCSLLLSLLDLFSFCSVVSGNVCSYIRWFHS